MRISWGIKIIFTFIIFALVIGTMVGISMTKNIDLVSENYYEIELKYQDKINMISRANALTEKIKIESTAQAIKVKYPDVFSNDNIKGKINFYRAMDKKKDFSIDISKNNYSIQEISTVSMDKGNWKMQIYWSVNGEDYFSESDLYIN